MWNFQEHLFTKHLRTTASQWIFNICWYADAISRCSCNLIATPLFAPVITDTLYDEKIFKFLNFNPNVGIRSSKQSCILLVSAESNHLYFDEQIYRIAAMSQSSFNKVAVRLCRKKIFGMAPFPWLWEYLLLKFPYLSKICVCVCDRKYLLQLNVWRHDLNGLRVILVEFIWGSGYFLRFSILKIKGWMYTEISFQSIHKIQYQRQSHPN